jgi:cytosine/adenosine deaminase-related metal-dependent hydrolase
MDSGAPRSELTPVASESLDLRAVEQRVRLAAAELRAGGLPAGTASSEDSELYRSSTAGPWLSPASATDTVVPYAQLSGSGPATALRRAIRRGLRWYLWPATARISEHNRAVSEVVAENARQLARLRMEVERTGRDLELLERR